MRNLTVGVVGGVLGLALTACGSTVQTAGRETLSGGNPGLAPADSAAAPEAAGSGLVTGTEVAPGGSNSSSGVGPASAGGSSAGRAGGTTPSGPAAQGSSPALAAASSGRGFTAKTVKIGVATAEDASAFASSFGLKGLGTGDTRGQIEAVVADINRHGGLAGRRVVPVVHNFNTAELLNNPASAMQAACAAWTEDDHVYAVVNPPLVEPNLLECLKKARTPLIYSSMDFPRTYSPVYAQYPDFFNLDAMPGELYDAVAIKRLVARNFFEKWDTLNGRPGATPTSIGMIVTDNPGGTLLTQSMTRELAKYGLKFSVVVRCPNNINEGVSCRQAAGLRFKSENVTHVFGSSVPFMQQSESQRYRPRYFLEYQPNTFAQNVPAEQLSGAMSESYVPMLDVAEGQDPGPPTSASKTCLEVMRKGGQQPDSRSVVWYMQTICDGLFFMKAAIDNHGALGDTALRPALEALGSRVPSAMTWATRLSRSQHAGTYGLRDLSFRSDCSCFAYTSKVTHTG
jgi:hypothetical protein